MIRQRIHLRRFAITDLVMRAATVPKARRATRPTRSSQVKRVDSKVRHGRIKALRGRVED